MMEEVVMVVKVNSSVREVPIRISGTSTAKMVGLPEVEVEVL